MPSNISNKISPIYKATKNWGIKGHVLGRKIGVMQEIIVWKLLRSSNLIKERVLGEVWVEGKSSAEHKVEFGIFSKIFSEKVASNESYDLETLGFNLKIKDIGSNFVRINVPNLTDKNCKINFSELNGVGLKKNYRNFFNEKNIRIKAFKIKGDHVQLVVLNLSDPLVHIESKRVGVEETKGKLLPAPQTIEKAKQTSLVAIDLRRKYGGVWKYNREIGRFISIAVLGNGVHWKKKDMAILSEYVDYVYKIKDEAIIRYINWILDKRSESDNRKKILLKYFKGTKSTPLDEFEVFIDDFYIVYPKISSKHFLDIIENQINKFNK